MVLYEPFQVLRSVLRHKPVVVAYTGTGKVDEGYSSAVDIESSLNSYMAFSRS